MSVFQAIVLALVQAATEFLPVSSTAHLILVPWLLGWPPHDLLFDIALHVGTLLAMMIYFFKTWVRLAFLTVGKEVWKPPPGDPDWELYQNPKLFAALVAATFPAGLAGLALQDYVETVFRGPVVIGVMLIVVAGVIALAERRGRFERDLGGLGFREALTIGCAQALALIPGVSRSGITISTAMFLGLTRHSAARFSFLLSTPILVGASAKASLDAFAGGGVPPDQRAAFLVGIAASAVFSYSVIALFLRFLRRSTLLGFVYYRVALGALVLALVYWDRLG